MLCTYETLFKVHKALSKYNCDVTARISFNQWLKITVEVFNREGPKISYAKIFTKEELENIKADILTDNFIADAELALKDMETNSG